MYTHHIDYITHQVENKEHIRNQSTYLTSRKDDQR
nr:MAG TPA: hypothetical protein [Caudoviricetes sp.]